MLLVVSVPVHPISLPEFLANSTRAILPFILDSLVFLTIRCTNHAPLAAAAADNRSMVIIVALWLLFLGSNLPVLECELTSHPLFRSGVVVQILAVVFGEGAMADTAAGGEMHFVLSLVDNGVVISGASFVLVVLIHRRSRRLGLPPVLFRPGNLHSAAVDRRRRVIGVRAAEIVELADLDLLILRLERDPAMALISHVGSDSGGTVPNGVAVETLVVLGNFAVEVVDEPVEVDEKVSLGNEHAVRFVHVIDVGLDIRRRAVAE